MSNCSLEKRCVVPKKEDGNRFVGIKADTDDVLVHFPFGFQLSDTDKGIRKDILNLFSILNEFKDIKEGHISKKNFKETDEVDFPINAYLDIIYYYMENGYYMETDPIFKTKERGKIDWPKTIRKQKPLLSHNKEKNTYSPVYTLFTVRESNPNENKEITRINQHCVYESFKKIGWIFTSFMPPKPKGKFNKAKFLIVLNDKLHKTNDDKKKRLFRSMIDMINYMDEKADKQLHFGTNKFENVFEKLIDKTFCNTNKEDFYPRTKWNLQQDVDYPIPYPLQPDTIMIYEDKVYVIDAKYYKYGITHLPSDLPKNSDVNKQISYGDYINSKHVYDSIYNAFLMPYNKEDNEFIDFNDDFENIGEAVAPWRDNKDSYEHIQGILVDIRFLMENYKSKSKSNIENLAKAIEKAYINNKDKFKEEN